nr:MAG TPA: hypothetical protein [Caudoviricetes sp.]
MQVLFGRIKVFSTFAQAVFTANRFINEYCWTFKFHYYGNN